MASAGCRGLSRVDMDSANWTGDDPFQTESGDRPCPRPLTFVALQGLAPVPDFRAMPDLRGFRPYRLPAITSRRQ